jgi:dihydropteridine reductase
MAGVSVSRSLLVLGGNGALGRSIVTEFSRAGWRAISADVGSFPPLLPSVSTIALSDSDGPSKQLDALLKGIDDHNKINNNSSDNSGFLDAVICVAGGWTGGAAGSDDFISGFERMNKVCLQPSVVAAQVAALRLRRSATTDNGSVVSAPPLFALTGAAAALSPSTCQGMLGYGLAKTATHFLTQALASGTAGLPSGSKSVCILPKTIDTPSNREHMPGADTTSWTPPVHIAAQLMKWCGVDVDLTRKETSNLKLFSDELTSGSLIVVETEEMKTSFRKV